MLLAVLGGCFFQSGWAQNPCCIIEDPGDTNVTVMRTGSIYALQTRTRPIFFPPEPWDYRITFEFGFGTDELPGEGEILDSVTLVLENTNTAASAVLFSADANGFTWLPFSPGLTTIDADALTYEPTEFLEIQPLPNQTLAYRVTLRVPALLDLGWSALQLVLYDYPNGLNSVGWLGPVEVIAPPGQLELISPDAFYSLGAEGRYFVPAHHEYALTNAGGMPLRWQAQTVAPWISLSAKIGDLDPGSSISVQVSINDLALGFLPGRYTNQVVFSDITSEVQAAAVGIDLRIVTMPRLEWVAQTSYDAFILRVVGTPSVRHRIDASGDFNSWNSIHTNTTSLDGTYFYTNAPLASERFFRAVALFP